ncbi:MAG: baseplate J/gp47 family protein [Muribaculaceae bacterium]|nr:baseplate J/gp47 family protein [Muribaculaceae bacterium]
MNSERTKMSTQEDIQERISDRLKIDANLLEGGFAQDIIGSVAYELANIKDTEIDTIADRCFVATAQNEDLDNVGNDYGLPRRESEAAIVYLEITGEQYAEINQNVKAIYNNLVYTVQEYKKINSSGVATVRAKCETLGTIGNVPANTINQFLTDYQGLRTVNNPEPAYDGFNREDDEVYRQRILDYLAEDATNANEAQYEKWAREVVGVQKAVIKSAEVMGAGNVGVFISAIDAQVSEDLKQSVYNHINEVQPINATVIVNSLNYVAIDVVANVVLKTDYEPVDVQDELEIKLKQYLPTVDKAVSYFKVSELLFDCSGVEDVIEYTLNGQSSSINIEDTDYPVIGEITITNNTSKSRARRK